MPVPDPQTENRLQAVAALQHLDELGNSKAFAWFMRTVLEKHRDDEMAKALAYPGKPEECERARHRYDLAKTLCDAPANLRQTHERLAKVN